jgi:hypothetical protein
MLTVTLNTAEFFYVVASVRMSVFGLPLYEESECLLSCVGHTADNPLSHTSALFVRKSERFLKPSQVNSHVKAVMACRNALGGSCGSSVSFIDELQQ